MDVREREAEGRSRWSTVAWVLRMPARGLPAAHTLQNAPTRGLARSRMPIHRTSMSSNPAEQMERGGVGGLRRTSNLDGSVCACADEADTV
jgi:hypothetical protein